MNSSENSRSTTISKTSSSTPRNSIGGVARRASMWWRARSPADGGDPFCRRISYASSRTIPFGAIQPARRIRSGWFEALRPKALHAIRFGPDDTFVFSAPARPGRLHSHLHDGQSGLHAADAFARCGQYLLPSSPLGHGRDPGVFRAARTGVTDRFDPLGFLSRKPAQYASWPE